MGAGTGRFGRSDRLHRSREFQDVLRRGLRVVEREFVLVMAQVPQQRAPRLGITVSRRVGNAVMRNRVKRGVREWFRRSRSRLEPGTDLVVIARTAVVRGSPGDIARALDRGLANARAQQ